MTTHDAPVEKVWTVQVDIGEYDGMTRATAQLSTGGKRTVSGTGVARLNPEDPDVPEIGDELATARALSALAHALLDNAADDISNVLHKPVTLTS
jgi:hypothetical protein